MTATRQREDAGRPPAPCFAAPSARSGAQPSHEALILSWVDSSEGRSVFQQFRDSPVDLPILFLPLPFSCGSCLSWFLSCVTLEETLGRTGGLTSAARRKERRGRRLFGFHGRQ